ncbi:MAG: 50S ribosomal protein L9 [Pseudomonadota bacterium]|nr:50S ribosomal protein L9 [Pseudomonadota bacterium]
MDVILLERIERLGQLGDVVRVKDGFARNHLIPQRRAVRATKDARESFEAQRASLEKENTERRETASVEAARIKGAQVVIVQQAGDSGQLYGAVRARDVAVALTAAGFPTTRKQVVLKSVVKSLGIYAVEVWLHAEEKVEVLVNVARSEEEARLQASGVDVVGDQVDAKPEVEALFEQVPEDPELGTDQAPDEENNAETELED